MSGTIDVGTIAQAGVVPTLEGRALQGATRHTIAVRGGYCRWDVDLAGWVVTPSSPEAQPTSGTSPRKR